MLELLVVLTILVALSFIVVPMFSDFRVVTPSGASESPVEIATSATLDTVREAIIGEDGVVESLSHKSNALPRSISEMTKTKAPEHIQATAPELAKYDPAIGIGWHGPYLRPTGTSPTGKPTVIDGWGNEIELQLDFDNDGKIDRDEVKYMRLVSAGPNGKIETPVDPENMKPGKNEAKQLTREECGDDIVVFVGVPDNR